MEALGAAFYAEAHLPGAVNLTPERFATHAMSVLPDRSAQIVVYGSVTSPSSGYVTRMLLGLGYHRVRHYPGGKEAWAEHGLPLQQGP